MFRRNGTVPRRRARLARALLLAVLLVLAAAGSLPVTPGLAAPPPGVNLDWRYYGNDLQNTRYQNVDLVNPTNVSQLQVAWVFHTGVVDPVASFEVSPIIVNGVMYITSPHDDVFALDATTGQQLWAYHALQDGMPPLDQVASFNRNNRGVAFGDNKVYLARFDAVLVALNAADGTVAWRATVGDWHTGDRMSLAPQFANGLVIAGTAGGELLARGKVAAYDASSGAQRWQTYMTLPGSTWAGNSWQTGGGPVWQTPAVDAARGVLYINSGNAAPDLNGQTRAGQNLYTVSVVALDLRSGAVKWYFQEVHHDVWDYDATQPNMLFDVTVGGTSYPALGECGKSGYYFMLDRRNGRPIYPVTEVPVPTTPGWQHPWPTQPMSSIDTLVPLSVQTNTSGYASAPAFTPPQQTPLVIQPGPDGGCQWPPAAFSPRTNYIYYGANYWPQLYQATPNDTTPEGGTVTDVTGVDHYSVFGATDATTGRIAWKIRMPVPTFSGMVVAGDLLFFGQDDGTFRAVSAATGASLWSFNASSIPNAGGANAAPAAYVVNGREFVVQAFGGNEGLSDYGSQPGDAVIAFALPVTK